MAADLGFTLDKQPDGVLCVNLDGDWSIQASRALEEGAEALLNAVKGTPRALIDFSQVHRLDTAGAWILSKARAQLISLGVMVDFASLSPEQQILLSTVDYRPQSVVPEPKPQGVVGLIADLGKMVVGVGHETIATISYLGEVMTALTKMALQPGQFRSTSLVYHMENYALRSLPLIITLNVLVGGTVAQQGLFLLRKFGTSSYIVELVGILAFRELAVLMTGIMIAGRVGSAITAEIGSMKMREEIDVLKVMGLSPTEILIAPRLLALIFSMPILVFFADMAELFGGIVMSWIYGGIHPSAFLARFQTAVGMKTIVAGLLKSPFMALVLGLIASQVGMKVQGSAESLGAHVTESVVKSVFMMIILDGVFAIFYTLINF